MCDTNWCTFCDCAVSPYSNSVYCSEACRNRDANVHNDLPTLFVEELHHKQGMSTVQLDSIMTPPLQPRRESQSSICSTDLAAMYFDSLPPTPKSVLGHDISSSPVSISTTICEKISPIMLNLPYSNFVSN